MKPNCRRCGASAAHVTRRGGLTTDFRWDDCKKLPRYFCNGSERSFSFATGSPRCYQKKRRQNAIIERLVSTAAGAPVALHRPLWLRVRTVAGGS